jgi:hypothetical protein
MPTLTRVVELSVQGHSIEANGQSKPIWNIFHWGNTSGFQGESALGMGNAFVAQIWPTIAAALSVGYVADQVLARFLDFATEQYAVCTKHTNGVVIGDRLPSHSAVTVRYKTAQRGKNYRGSKHFAPVAEGDTLTDEIDPAQQAKWNTLTTAISSAFVVTGTGGVWSPAVVSRNLSQLKTDPVSIVGAYVTQGILNLTIGTMRHRKEKTKHA